MPPPFTLRWLVLDNGERLPLLVNPADGQPLFQPTVYSVAAVRNRNVASNTLRAHLRAILHLYTWATQQGLDVEERMKEKKVLTLAEVESLSQAVRMPLRTLSGKRTRGVEARSGVKPLESHRQRQARAQPSLVDPRTAATRLHCIQAYLEWLSLTRIGSLQASDRSDYDASRQRMLTALKARIPVTTSRAQEGARKGLEPETVTKLLAIIDPASADNPWNEQKTRFRNRLLIAMLLELGIRRGEALSIRVEHLDLRGNTVLIARTPDALDDPRREQPNTKTRDRKLTLSDALAEMIYHYITQVRSKVRGARFHSFLFVAHDTGKPMSLATFSKIFRELRSCGQDIPTNLSGHTLRHTWNDRFSELMDEKKITEAEESKIRSYLMGWSDTSDTAATYTKRHIRKKASKLLLEMQKR